VSAVAVLATGIMGAGMAGSLVRAGHEVRAWNRTRERADALAGDGVTVAGAPAAAVAGADVVVTMLSDADAVLDVVDRAADRFGDAVWAQMSTVGLEGIERCGLLAAERGLVLVDAPVVGTKQPAERGELLILAAGPPEALDRCAPAFEAMARRTRRLGDEAGPATRMKLVVNAWILTLVEGLAETVALAEGLAVDPAAFLAAIAGDSVDSPYAQTKGRLMVERDFPPSFPLRLAAKDAALVVAATERHGLDLPLPRAVARAAGPGGVATTPARTWPPRS
jgi:3-hydroxyisobutyrate dehydrogenase